MKKQIIEDLNKMEKIETYTLLTDKAISMKGTENQLLTLLTCYIITLQEEIDIEKILKAIIIGTDMNKGGKKIWKNGKKNRENLN